MEGAYTLGKSLGGARFHIDRTSSIGSSMLGAIVPSEASASLQRYMYSLEIEKALRDTTLLFPK